MEYIKNWITTIVVVSIIIIIIEMIIPSGKSKNYIKTISGMVIIIVIITPISQIISGRIDFTESLFKNQTYINKLEIKKNHEFFESKRNTMIINEYRNRIIEHIKYTTLKSNFVKAVEADIILNEDINSNDFGALRRIYVYIAVESEGSEKSSIVSSAISQIKKVTIESVEVITTQNNKKSEFVRESSDSQQILNEKQQSEVLKRLSEVFSVEENNIIIGIME